jgi:hypothetical protein
VAQGGIAAAVPEPVVDRLEVVEVDGNDRVAARLGSPRRLALFQQLVQGLAIAEAGQRVGHRQRA